MDWGEDPDGATPLTEEQRAGLKLAWVGTRDELNEAEAENILLGTEKWHRRGLSIEDLLDDRSVRNLHRDMFGTVWTWAGRYRLTDLNIGVDWSKVAVEVRNLTEDAKYWFAGSEISIDTAGARFHHRLVQIHPFPNGNGRHAREITDLILQSVGVEPFSWGRNTISSVGLTRTAYVAALRAADIGDHTPLVEFVRT